MKSALARISSKHMLKLSKTSTSRVNIIAGGIILILIAVVAIGVWKISIHLDEQNKIYFANNSNLPIKIYSLSGKITKVDSKEIQLEVGQVVNNDKGNVLEYKTYVIQIANDTTILKQNSQGKFDPALITEIKVGKEVTAYTHRTPYKTQAFTATKIEIN